MIGENMVNDIEKVLISEEELSEIVKDLGKKISEDYKDKNLLLVSVLKGSVMFMADLMREITIPCNIDFMAVSSYGSGSKSSGVVKIIKDLDKSIEGKDLLIVEDILDSGRTLNYIKTILEARGIRSLKICTLFDKPERREVDLFADYIGAKVPNEFIVGYGLDYDEYYRNLPYIGALKRSVYENE
jgi:hypoxanthine phosphoribosyltransferase